MQEWIRMILVASLVGIQTPGLALSSARRPVPQVDLYSVQGLSLRALAYSAWAPRQPRVVMIQDETRAILGDAVHFSRSEWLNRQMTRRNFMNALGASA